MANEISVNVQVTLSNGGLTDSFSPGQIAITQTTLGKHALVQSIPTTAAGTALTNPITGNGVFYARNTDATNYIEVGVQVAGTFYPLHKLKPSEVCVGRLGTTAPYARANTAAAKLFFAHYEE